MNDTSLDPEEYAYPSGAIRAGRKARVLCPDGKIRTALVGIPDTFFSIPASVKAYGKTVAGFVACEEYMSEPLYVFKAYTYRKNHRVFWSAERTEGR